MESEFWISRSSMATVKLHLLSNKTKQKRLNSLNIKLFDRRSRISGMVSRTAVHRVKKKILFLKARFSVLLLDCLVIVHKVMF